MEPCSHGGQCFVFDYCLECIPIAIQWTGFTKYNHLMSCIRVANALHAVIIFIMWFASNKNKVLGLDLYLATLLILIHIWYVAVPIKAM